MTGGDFFNHPRERNDLEGITAEEGHPRYHSAGNCLIETESKTLILGCKNSVIPDDGSVEKISADAFSYCDGLTTVVLSNNVGTISAGAFENCNRLSSVFYLGTQEERKNNLWIENQNEPIALATWYYYSEEKPEEEGNYWHYVDSEPTVW